MKKQEIFGKLFPFLKSSFVTGFWKIFPLIVFIWFIYWVVSFLLGVIEMLEKLFPQPIADFTGLPEYVVKSLEIIAIFIVILIVGILANQKNINEKFSKWVAPKIYKIPVLGFLYGVTNKISIRNLINLFKEAVYVEMAPGVYERGFVVGDTPEKFSKSLKKKNMKTVMSLFFPFTSAMIRDVEPEKLTPIGASVTEVATSIATVNLSQANDNKTEKEYLDESHSETEWDFFYCFSLL